VRLPQGLKLVGADTFDGFTPSGRRLVPADWPLARAALKGETVRDEQIHLRPPGRPEIIIEANAAPVRDAQGRITAAVVVFQDITERRRADDALREADRRKDEFLAMLSHELRNPLAPIRNAVQVLQTPSASAAQREKAQEIIARQVGSLTRLVDDLLDISRITRGRIELRKTTFDLAAAVSRAVETARPLIESRRQRLSLALPAEPILLEGDLVRLAQVISNLLNNAAKFTPEGGWIEVSAERQDGRAVVRVRDDGAGISEGDLGKIFNLFVQADRTLTRSEGGLGIGLTLVRSLVEMHGGTVEARSEGPGRGSEMVVSLPLR
jgi:signal transduction histidine kinase